jgi:hypothetical protein
MRVDSKMINLKLIMLNGPDLEFGSDLGTDLDFKEISIDSAEIPMLLADIMWR